MKARRTGSQVFVRQDEADLMQFFRDAGRSIEDIAAIFGRCAPTVAEHTQGGGRRRQIAQRNALLNDLTAGRPQAERDAVAKRFGLAGYASLDVIMHRYRRMLQASRQAANARKRLKAHASEARP